MKIYIAGKITGDTDYREKFFQAARKMKNLWPNSVVMNPARTPSGLTRAEYMRLSFAMIDAADVVVLLPDWKESLGARLEVQYCDYVDKRTVDFCD